MPSSRAQICATAGAFWVVTRNAGCTSTARSTNRRTASYCVSASTAGGRCASGTASDGTRHAISPPMPSASRLVASTRTGGHARRRASARRAQASTRCSQLSSTSSRRVGRSASVRVASSGRPGSSRTPTAPATAWGTSTGSARAASSDQPGPVRVVLQRVRRRLQGQAGLARPSGAGQRHQPVGPQEPAHVRQLPLPAHEAGQLQGQVVGQGVQRAQGGEVAGEPRGGELEHPLGPGQVLQAVLPQVAQPRAGREGVPHQIVGGLGQHRLPPVGRGQQARAAVERRPEVVPPLALHLARVHPHPGLDGPRPQLAPVRRLEGQLPGQRRRRPRRWLGRRRRRPRPPPSRRRRPRAPPPPPGAGRGGGARRPGRRRGGPGARGCCPPGR